MISFKQYLAESISVSGNELLAYAMVVHEEYTKMKSFDKSEAWRWHKMMQNFEKVLPRLMSKVKVEIVKDDPYDSLEKVMYDIMVNKRLKVFHTPDPDSHPTMTQAQNDLFRTGHDFFGHFAPNSAVFADFMKKNNIKSTKDAKFKEFKLPTKNFTFRGEISAYLIHAKMSSPEVRPALFTEIVGQTAVYVVTKDFTDNKVGVIKGVDFKNIGKFTSSSLDGRKQKYMEMLDNPDVKKIKLKTGHTVDKSKVDWDIVSPGEGAVHRKRGKQ